MRAASNRRRGFLLGLLAVALAQGCAGGVTRRVSRPATSLGLTALVVYPVALTGDQAPAWRTLELGSRLTAAVVEAGGDRLAVLGPTELKVLRWEDEAAWVASDALPTLVRLGHPAERAAVLRARLERRVGSQSHEARDSRGRARAASASEETTWVVAVELLHPSSGALLAELSSQVVLDPFASPTGEEEFDPAPPMTHLLETLAAEATRVALGQAAARPPADPPTVVVAESPAEVLRQPDPQVARLDALAAELWRQNRARFLTPTLPEAQVARVAVQRPGLYVLEAPRHARIRPGDLIVSVDGQPPLRQVLARRRLQGTPVPVRVLRGGAEVEATVP